MVHRYFQQFGEYHIEDTLPISRRCTSIVDTFEQQVVMFFTISVLFSLFQPSIIATSADLCNLTERNDALFQLKLLNHRVNCFVFFRCDPLCFFTCLSSSSSFFSNSFSPSRYLMRPSAFSSFFLADRSSVEAGPYCLLRSALQRSLLFHNF